MLTRLYLCRKRFHPSPIPLFDKFGEPRNRARFHEAVLEKPRSLHNMRQTLHDTNQDLHNIDEGDHDSDVVLSSGTSLGAHWLLLGRFTN